MLEKEFEPHQKRVIDEKTELDIKIRLLNLFINTNSTFKALSTDDQELLKEQSIVMSKYSEILDKRIAKF